MRSGLRVVFVLIVLVISSAVIVLVFDVPDTVFPDLPGFNHSIPPDPDQANDTFETRPAPRYTYTLVNTYPHDPDAFTEGLAYDNGILYEGTGLYGSSTIRKTDLVSGKLFGLYKMPPDYFGEGVTVLDDNLYQLTYQSHTIFVYDEGTLELKKTANTTPNGWGLTDDGTRLIMSDGSSTLYFLDPVSLAITGRMEVNDGGVPVTRLNELEYIEGEIFANIWQEERIARISARDGSVTGWIDLTGLAEKTGEEHPTGDLNGIAYDATGKRLFVTGKLWPEIVEIALIPAVPPGTTLQ